MGPCCLFNCYFHTGIKEKFHTRKQNNDKKTIQILILLSTMGVGAVVVCWLWIERSLVQILHWPNMNFSGHKKLIWLRLHMTKVWIDSLRGQCLCKFDIPWCHMLTLQRNIFHRETGTLVSLCSRMIRQSYIMSKCWMTELLKAALTNLISFTFSGG